MAGERLGEALLDLDTRDTKFNQGVDRSERRANKLGLSFDATSAKAAKMGKGLALAAAAGTAALGVLVKKTIDNADAMSKAAARAGTTTEALSRLAWAGDLSDVSVETLTGSIYRLSNAMAQASSGKDKDLEAIFKGLGIAVTDADGRLRSADTVLMDFADVFATLENGAEKTALAVKVFGRSGAQLIPLLNNGRRGLQEMADEADRLGLTISTKMGKDAEQFNDTLTRIQAIFKGLVVQISADMLPALQDFADKLADPSFRQEAQEMAEAVVSAFGMIATAIQSVLDLMVQAGEAWSTLKGWVEWANTHDMFGNEMAPDFQGALDTAGGAAAKGDRLASGGNRFDAAFSAANVNAGRTINPEPAAAALPPSLTKLLGGGGSGSGGGGTSELQRQKEAVQDLIRSLEEEIAVNRTMDPVEQEMIRLRGTLAGATDAQKAKVEDLLTTAMREQEQLYALQDAFQSFGDMAVEALDGLLDGSKSLDDSLADLAKSMQNMVLQAALLGQGPLANLFGMGSSSGGIGGGVFGALGSVFAGMFAKGGLIPEGQFGIVGDAGPEPVIGTKNGAMVLPSSSLRSIGAGGGGGQFNFSQSITPPDGFETRTREQDSPGGKRQEVWFEEAVGSAIGKRGPAQAAVRNAGRLTRR
ncbi:MAG: hypothetical protein ABJD05_15820 [Roseibium sp.]|uniref:hypothetical protein n=1 Tax=Roseibium sp. TaxID=1936156 RepID=UPI003267425A